MRVPAEFPNFNCKILHTAAEWERVHVFVEYTVENLESSAMHMFVEKVGLQTEFLIFDDTHKITAALESLNSVGYNRERQLNHSGYFLTP